MTEKSISKLIELAKGARVTEQQKAEQRRSFVYGNTAFENEDITLELFQSEVSAMENAPRETKQFL